MNGANLGCHHLATGWGWGYSLITWTPKTVATTEELLVGCQVSASLMTMPPTNNQYLTIKISACVGFVYIGPFVTLATAVTRLTHQREMVNNTNSLSAIYNDRHQTLNQPYDPVKHRYQADRFWLLLGKGSPCAGQKIVASH